MSQILSIYPNCSLGGMGTVYRTRAKREPQNHHTLFFTKDAGARSSLEELDNTFVRIVHENSLLQHLTFTLNKVPHQEVRTTSLPSVASKIKDIQPNVENIYEFHTSDEGIIKKEIGLLDLNKIDRFFVPSDYLRNVVSMLLPATQHSKINVFPNHPDTEFFNADTPAIQLQQKGRPLIWIGRFDKGKNVRDFYRLLSLVSEEWYGIVVMSLVSDASIVGSSLLEAAQYGVHERIKLLINLPPQNIASLYAFAREKSGAFVSTSLNESFGFGVLEAALCGLPVVGYDVGALKEHSAHGFNIDLVDVGGVFDLVDAVKQISLIDNWRQVSSTNLAAANSYISSNKTDNFVSLEDTPETHFENSMM